MAAILSRETRKALFYHAKPRSGNHEGETWRGKTKLFWSPGAIWPPCDKGELEILLNKLIRGDAKIKARWKHSERYTSPVAWPSLFTYEQDVFLSMVTLGNSGRKHPGAPNISQPSNCWCRSLNEKNETCGNLIRKKHRRHKIKQNF